MDTIQTFPSSSSVTKEKGIAVCDDGIENNYRDLSPFCQYAIYKHKLCDEVQDCDDNGNEDNIECRELVNTTCVRVYGNMIVDIPPDHG